MLRLSVGGTPVYTRRGWLTSALSIAASLKAQDRRQLTSTRRQPASINGLKLDSDSIGSLTREFTNGQFTGVIGASLVDGIRKRNSITIEQLLQRLLPLAQELAFPPITNFRVGATMLGESGSIYLGGNIEVQGESAALCVHAEQCAASLLYANREKAVRALAVTAAPCGHCRQFLYELVGKSSFEIHLAARN